MAKAQGPYVKPLVRHVFTAVHQVFQALASDLLIEPDATDAKTAFKGPFVREVRMELADEGATLSGEATHGRVLWKGTPTFAKEKEALRILGANFQEKTFPHLIVPKAKKGSGPIALEAKEESKGTFVGGAVKQEGSNVTVAPSSLLDVQTLPLPLSSPDGDGHEMQAEYEAGMSWLMGQSEADNGDLDQWDHELGLEE